MAVKKVKVREILKMEAGLEFNLNDFQVAAGDQHGNMFVANLDVTSEEDDTDKEYKIAPGSFLVNSETGLTPLNFPDEKYFITASTERLFKHFNVFYTKIELMKKRGRIKRGVLLGGAPGQGKSAAVRYFVRQITQTPDKRICVLRVDSEDVCWETLTKMFIKADVNAVDFVVLILEDLGGSGLNERNARLSPSCLNFLDGNSDVFKIPTLIVGTTNYINELGAVVTSRPGRFDTVEHVLPPSDDEVLLIAENELGRELSEAEKTSLSGKAFTPAYVIESLIRSELYDISLEESIDHIEKQRKLSENKKHGEALSSLGFGDFDE